MRRWVAIAQPTMRRLQASNTTAKYKKPARRGDVGDVGHPELIGSLCSEVALDEILRHVVIVCPTRRPDMAASTDAPQTRLTHQPSNTLETHMGTLID